MKYLDYLFWSYYCFANRHKKFYFGDNVYQAVAMMYGTIAMPIFSVYIIVDTFIISLFKTPAPGTPMGWIIGAILTLPIVELLYKRYNSQKLKKEKYKIFRDRWGSDPRKNRKGSITVLAYTLFVIIGTPILAIIIGEMKRHGLLEGFPLFPY